MNYTRQNPYLASISRRHCLNLPGSDKETLHIELDLAGSGLRYEPGDSLAILPRNDPEVVQLTLEALRANGSERVLDARSGELFESREFFAKKANITKVNKPLLTYLHSKQQASAKRAQLEEVLHSHEALGAYSSRFEVWDLLQEHAEADCDLQEVCKCLAPLLPRFYSLASAQEAVGEEAHLTVAMVDYVTNGYRRSGVASQFLGRNCPLKEPCVPIYLQPAHAFRLPEDLSASVIMIGPGTGVAPYRAFMQKRLFENASGKHWLFFGECRRDTDYLYGDFWEELQSRGILRVDTAFSRDQEEKVYVQHRIHENAASLWQWLQEGAYLYVCGDAHHMAKDVDAALHRLVSEQGKLNEDEARLYVRSLKQAKRYLRDVY